MDSVDIIASGYEWICPECNTLNNEIEYPRGTVRCCNLQCKTDFECEPPEHAYG